MHHSHKLVCCYCGYVGSSNNHACIGLIRLDPLKMATRFYLRLVSTYRNALLFVLKHQVENKPT